MYAASNQVDNLIVTVDYNGQQIDGSLDQVLSLGNLAAKFEAFGWLVIDINDGNDLNSVISGLKSAQEHTGKGKPICLLMHTVMGHGVDFMMNTHAWHGKAPNDEQLALALSQNPETLGDY
jgi:transketolase